MLLDHLVETSLILNELFLLILSLQIIFVLLSLSIVDKLLLLFKQGNAKGTKK